MFPLTSCGHRGVKFHSAAAAAAAGRPQKVCREGWAFWGPLENNHRRVAFFNCIYLSVLSPRHRLLCGIDTQRQTSRYGPVGDRSGDLGHAWDNV